MCRLIVLALAAAMGVSACGDNLLATGVALVPTAELVVVAHQDDDLLFMQPDVTEAVQRGNGVTTVYVTAGNGTKGTDRADRRYEGLMSAYGTAAGASDWRCGYIDLAGHVAQHCRLDAKNVSLVFLGYPDGGKEGELDGSLLALWEGRVTNVETVATETTRYDRDSLIATVAYIMRVTQPKTVRTLEVASTHGRDHSDHMLVGALTLTAIASANNHADLIAYRGYAIAEEPPNKTTPLFDAAFAVLSRYEACATDCAACGDACTAIDQTHVTWLRRRYAIGFRPTAAGRLRNGASCLGSDLALTSCMTAPVWALDSNGQLRTEDNQCIEMLPNGELALGVCLGGRERRFFLDDEGHIWSGMPPTPEPMSYAHLWCLAPTTTGAHFRLCGRDQAPTWELAPRTTETSRLDIAFAATGREARLGDLTGDGKADLCAIEDNLICAAGNGMGGFMPAARIDHFATPLAIDARSLTLGDVDGDGRLDACGRDAEGVLCATAAREFRAERWSPSFSDALARTSTSASLAAIDANADGNADICGVDVTGVVCAPRGLTLQPTVRSAWSELTVVWPADLDGDRQADWCTATDLGPACGVEAHHDLTTDGVPWGYSQGGEVDIAPATTATVALADIDGDGRADLCSPREDRIRCARSQGRAFGPHTTTIAILPNQSVASALWLGDLDGDGRADPCVDTGPTIVCAVNP